ncbi:MAG: hypothetical protein FWC11_05455 [Firmicutes bacterium]|nr:hypothetical protein [Bacillota bacterium]
MIRVLVSSARDYYYEKFFDKGIKDALPRVFDPLDEECEYTQNPTNQSKTVDKGLRPS